MAHVRIAPAGEALISLSELRGRRVLLQFSAAYNRAARESNLVLSALHTSMRKAGRGDLVVLALYDGSASDAEAGAYARSAELPFPIGLVAGGVESPSIGAYGVRRLPTLFAIDAHGIVQAVDPPPEALLKLAQ